MSQNDFLTQPLSWINTLTDEQAGLLKTKLRTRTSHLKEMRPVYQTFPECGHELTIKACGVPAVDKHHENLVDLQLTICLLTPKGERCFCDDFFGVCSYWNGNQ